MITYLVLIWLDWIGRLTPKPSTCPDFIDDYELTWADDGEIKNETAGWAPPLALSSAHPAAVLDDPDVIACGRMYVEHCYKLKARR